MSDEHGRGSNLPFEPSTRRVVDVMKYRNALEFGQLASVHMEMSVVVGNNAYIENLAKRSQKSKSFQCILAAYLELTARRNQSGETDANGRISRWRIGCSELICSKLRPSCCIAPRNGHPSRPAAVAAPTLARLNPHGAYPQRGLKLCPERWSSAPEWRHQFGVRLAPKGK
jgi:hypothetical protein